MEIPRIWHVQEFVANHDGDSFMNKDVGKAVGSQAPTVAHILENMECVRLVYKGNRQVYGNSDRNIYTRLPPGERCSKCRYEQNGKSGCVIVREDLRKLFMEERPNQIQEIIGKHSEVYSEAK
jgi:hypothetical protein